MLSHHERFVGLLAAVVLLLPAAVAAQQTGTVSGRITDASTGRPVADAQLRVAGTLLGTTSGDDGAYEITAVPAGAQSITVRRLGYEGTSRTVTVTAAQTTTADFQLRAAAVTLGQVVVSGVGAPAERRVVGNTVETVAGSDVSESPGATSIDQALQGKITGAVISENSGQPGGGVSIRLRGTNSILGGSEPLYVVDGVIIDNSSDALVSLGANASRGNAALSNRLADLDPDEIDHIEVLKGAAAAALYGSRANNGVIQIFTKHGRAGKTHVTVKGEYSLEKTPDFYALNMSPTAGYADVVFGGADSIGAPVQRFDIQPQIFRTGQGTNDQVSISGGNGGTTYYLSGGYDTEQGILRSTDYRRWNARTNLSQQLSDKLQVSLGANYIRSKADFVPEGEQTQGLLTSVIFTPTSYNPTFDKATGSYPYNPVLGPNPFVIMNQFEAPETVARFLGNVTITARPFSHLSLKYLAGVDDYRQEDKYFQPPFSTSSSFTGSVENPAATSRLFNNDLTATYDMEPMSGLGLTSTAGFRYTSNWHETVEAAAGNLPPVTDIVTGAVQTASQSIAEFRTVGWYLEERAAIAGRLYLTGGLNWDASSAFGPDERLQLFPRAGLSWVLGEEPFWKRSIGNVFSSFRLRAAFGETGGQPPGLYSQFNNFVNLNFSGKPGLVASTTAGNDSLKPERQREYEMGFDAGLFKDRAQLEFTYYNKRTTDLVLSVPLPPSTGFLQQFQNIGELSNKGVEIALNTVNVERPSFTWRSRLTYAANRNRIQRLATSADTLLVGYLNAVIEGQPIGVFYGGVYARDANGKIAYKPTVVKINGRDSTVMLPYRGTVTLPDGSTAFANRIIGDPNPDFTATFSNSFDLGKHLQMSVLLDGRFGNDVANFTRRISELFGVGKDTQGEFTGDTIPFTYTLNPNGRSLIYEEYIEDGSFVKLREVALQYLFDKPWIRRFGAQSMTVRLAARNLYTWTNYSGLDPEVNLFSENTVARGVDFATTPLPRQFTLDLTLSY
ncbi:MAG TPA: SusC/RagA family TonB-linked outer membrane protein [Gemmatimonadaceae bacterium]|nr:SusC/RagA family TonB-linked outer membrane protein [Gemmatimonadaceae bacterium]